MPINELRSITTFVKTAELGSLRKAASAQGITPQRASQALTQLERHLGVRLFHRTTRSMSLTEEGRRLLEMAQPALLGLQRAFQATKIARDEIAGPLRIVGPRSMFLPVVGPVLEEFCRQYPEIRPDVQLDDRLGNWVEDRVDVGFRAGLSAHDGVVARRLFVLQSIICAAPEYLSRHGVPGSIEALGSHKCSVFRHSHTGHVIPWHFKIGAAVVDHHVAPAFCTNDEELELQAVLAGTVIGQLANVTIAKYIRSGRLIPLLVRHVADQAGYFIYYGSRASQPARARAFIDLALRRLRDDNEFVLSDKELVMAERRARGLMK
ncbi:MAG: LysR family transcriptional regulator [Candidatus Accumulibacter sp.]|jgi:DNA-binding transcriptional LysR family regulator|nr:LysR family transcriptional regulator [Accumulibacter sp.]